MQFNRIKTVSRKDLLKFLNKSEFPNRTKDVTEAHQKMCECVELLLRYKDEIQETGKTITDPRDLKIVEWNLSRALFIEVWNDRLQKIVKSANELIVQPH